PAVDADLVGGTSAPGGVTCLPAHHAAKSGIRSDRGVHLRRAARAGRAAAWRGGACRKVFAPRPQAHHRHETNTSPQAHHRHRDHLDQPEYTTSEALLNGHLPPGICPLRPAWQTVLPWRTESNMRTVDIVVFTSKLCNLRCKYCYELPLLSDKTRITLE